ncbi:hypothetical protein [Zestomonas carbonaria]|uniref:Uncharacterized protein n=1 Tax=Zestomonas carbonaria TaxID=2762745 RepID=A0A7U7ENE3_9GAMM|nr:hypothetical protein [Pseudomonas carbonaria]CAD5107833.1 hypothetical protein PSEWESI4_02110 [Pseudomonas carbonaria]
MKLEIARGLFLVGALGVASLAAAAWHEPGPQVLSSAGLKQHCPLPPQSRGMPVVRADGNLLLLMFGLSQGVVGPQR